MSFVRFCKILTNVLQNRGRQAFGASCVNNNKKSFKDKYFLERSKNKHAE